MSDLTLSDVEMVILATRQCSPAEAHAIYLSIEDILINLEHKFALHPGTVTATSLHRRSQPSATAASLGQLTEHYPVEVWGITPDGQWLAIRMADKRAGWVSRPYIQET
jgi:hypothetical protein